MRKFADLSERELLALAISNEEEDGRIYADYAEGLRQDYPSTAKIFTEMAAEENEHRRSLIDLFVSKFGDHIPLVRRQDIAGGTRLQADLAYPPARRVDRVRRQARQMEQDAARFYRLALERVSDANIRKLLGDLAEAEDRHDHEAATLETETSDRRRPPGRRRERPPVSSSCRSSSRASRASWTARYRPWLRCSRRLRHPYLAHIPGGLAARSVRVSRWASPRPYRTTAGSPAAAHP